MAAFGLFRKRDPEPVAAADEPKVATAAAAPADNPSPDTGSAGKSSSCWNSSSKA